MAIKTGKLLEAALDKIFEDLKSSKGHMHIRALDEKEKQEDLEKQLFSDDDVSDSSQDNQETENDEDKSGDNKPEESPEDKEKLESGDIEVKDIIEKINTIRAGKSLKDSDVSGNMEKYIGDMKTPERTALYAFLKGIAQIVSAEVPGKAATEPADKPADVQMSKDEYKGKQTFHIKPNVISKQAGKQPEAPSSNAEDTTPPQKLPIAAKKR